MDRSLKQKWIVLLSYGAGHASILIEPLFCLPGEKFGPVDMVVDEAQYLFLRFGGWDRVRFADLLPSIQEQREFGLEIEATAQDLSGIGILNQLQ